MDIISQSTITCPQCGTAKVETMPTDACQFSTIARAVVHCFVLSPKIAACFARMGRCHARLFKRQEARAIAALSAQQTDCNSPPSRRRKEGWKGIRRMMEHGMMSGTMMWDMGLIGLLLIVLLVLGLAALVKYLLSLDRL